MGGIILRKGEEGWLVFIFVNGFFPGCMGEVSRDLKEREQQRGRPTLCVLNGCEHLKSSVSGFDRFCERKKQAKGYNNKLNVENVCVAQREAQQVNKSRETCEKEEANRADVAGSTWDVSRATAAAGAMLFQPFKKLTTLSLCKAEMGVGPVIDRVSVFQDGIRMEGESVSENAFTYFTQSGRYHSPLGMPISQLPGYTLQHEISSDSEMVQTQTGEFGIRERSISVVLERFRTGRLGKDFWMKDENCLACFMCDVAFTTAWRRRHHCRTCGQIFCSRCTTLIPGTNFGHVEYLRVCNLCNKIINEYKGVNIDGEDGQTFSERYWLRSVSQSPFKSNHIMNVLFPKKQSPKMSFSQKNSQYLSLNTLNMSETLSSISFGSINTIDSDASDTNENYMEPSSKSFNIDSLKDSVMPSKQDLVLKTKEKRFFNKRNRFLSLDMTLFNTPSSDIKKTSSLLAASPAFTKIDDNTLVYKDNFPSEGEKLIITELGDKEIKKSDQYIRKQKRNNKKHEKYRVSVEYMKNSEGSKNTSFTRSFSNIHLKKSQKLSSNDSFLKIMDTNSLPLSYIQELLKQLLLDFNISFISNWERVLIPILFKIVDNINPNVRNGDDIDIRHYVKIKKILGNDPALSYYVQGLVFTKKLALKKMSTFLVSPRIVLITFPIEYHRTETHFMSLDPVIAQEKEYLRNLVNRIIALHPTILFVEKSVSGLAMQYLSESNIVVTSNVKPSVIQAISRCTRADIISSIDKLALSPRVGKCAYFSLKTFVSPETPNIKKTFIFLEGCPKDLGCTVVLRGSTSQELSFIKQVVELMAYVVYNLKLEVYLMRDHFVSLSNIPLNQLILNFSKSFMNSDDTFQISYDAIINAFESRLLSASPYVKFPPPYMLLKVRDSEKCLKTLLNGGKSDSLIQRIHNLLKEISIFDNDRLLLNVDIEEILKSDEIERLQQELKVQEKNWKSYFLQDIGIANPFSQQGFAVLYSSVCTASAIPCEGPCMNIIEYYRETDCTLGQYIEDMCSTVNIICNANLCGKRLFEHHRCYVHDHARITVVIQELDHPVLEMQKNIFIWSHCKICKKNTPMIPMSDNTWKYSFGKYLELAFYGVALSSKADACNHDINKDHIRYFGYQNFLIEFQFDYIELYGLLLPQTEIVWKPEEWIRIKLEEYNSIKSKIEKFCDSVEVRLNGIALNTIPLDKFEVCRLGIDHFKKKIKDDRILLLDLLKNSFENSHPLKTLSLNRVLRTMQEMVAQWDFDFSEFDKNFFPSEKDLRRFTSLHLRKFFTDKDFISYNNYSKGLENKNDLLAIKRVSSEKNLKFMSSSESNLSLNSKHNVDMDVSSVRKEMINVSDQEQNTVFSKNKCNVLYDNLNKKVDEFSDSNKSSQLHNFDDETEENDITDKRAVTEFQNKPICDINNVNFSEKLNIQGESSTFPVSSFGSFPFKNSFFRKNFIKILKFDHKFYGHNFKKDTFQDISKLKNINFQSSVKYKENLETPLKPDISKNFSESNVSHGFKQFNRELENRQTRRHIKIKKNYAFPPSSSRPIVEVFQNVQEAVNETSDDEIIINERKRTNINFKKRNKYDSSLDKKGKRKMQRSQTIDSFNLYGNSMDLENSEKDSDLSSLEIFYTSAECFKFSNDDIVDEIPTHRAERISLMKALFAFWVDRATVGWSPLSYPLNPSEHVFTDSDIIVREDEPSSLIAFVLSSADYLDKLKEMEHIKILGNILENLKTEEKLKDLKNLTKKPLEEALLKPVGTHLKYQFQEGSARLFCKVFYAEQFDAFRRACNCDENYLLSLSRCFKWESSGGKSGSMFLKTRGKIYVFVKYTFLIFLDDRLVLKQLSRLETEAFIKFAPSYFKYMSQAFFHDLPTVMAKIIGFYQIGSRNHHTGKVTKMDILVTENLFYGRKTSRIFDLKGSMRNRHVQSTGRENEVLLDENLVEFIYDSPLFIREHFKKILRASLWNDTLFLARMNVMDYSMVVGIDDEKQELIVGIIESWVKEKGLVGGGGKEPTVVTPRQYKNRFREAMDSYIYGSPSRIAYVLLKQNIFPKDIVVVTFTNKAAKEIKNRIDTIIGTDVSKDLISGTFHSFARRYLVKYGYLIGLDVFSIIDRSDSIFLIKKYLKEKDLIDLYISINNTTVKLSANSIINIISSLKSRGISTNTYLDVKKSSILSGLYYHQEILDIYCYYQEYLSKNKLFDFDDLLLYCLRLFKENPKCFKNIKHVFVDEYQDTSLVQYNLIKYLVSGESYLTIVGDPDQSIYGFRSADITNFERMKQDFPDSTIVFLEENFRSSGAILDTALKLIEQGFTPILNVLEDHIEEAYWIAKEIRKYVNNTCGFLTYKDFSILVRSSVLTQSIEHAFQKFNINYKMVGAHGFYDRQEVKDIIAYLRLICFNDELSLLRIINVPKRGFGKSTLELIGKISETTKKPILLVLEEISRGEYHIEKKNKKMENSISTFVNILGEIKDYIKKKINMPVSDIILYICKLINYEKYLSKEFPSDSHDRWNNILQLINNSDVIDSDIDNVDFHLNGINDIYIYQKPLIKFLDNISLFSDITENENVSIPKVTISTIHAAKGLEWPIVFLPGLYNGSIPHSRAEDISEERRLLYVAITRAQAMLYLSYPLKNSLQEKLKKISTITLFEKQSPKLNTTFIKIISELLKRPRPNFDFSIFINNTIDDTLCSFYEEKTNENTKIQTEHSKKYNDETNISKNHTNLEQTGFINLKAILYNHLNDSNQINMSEKKEYDSKKHKKQHSKEHICENKTSYSDSLTKFELQSIDDHIYIQEPNIQENMCSDDDILSKSQTTAYPAQFVQFSEVNKSKTIPIVKRLGIRRSMPKRTILRSV
ncbi:hypothetical protein PORY_000180 [Pneumocystis oryctolagi]|uniref:Uncharacterized protein n=1 Tax=Pneumocystis oryctolagi TaxID=42067 RepID=A0ACB7CHC3_9ASCO|nr:hypothetical protein PORY_000180 [Pneumocystis oryctolagi]